MYLSYSNARDRPQGSVISVVKIIKLKTPLPEEWCNNKYSNASEKLFQKLYLFPPIFFILLTENYPAPQNEARLNSYVNWSINTVKCHKFDLCKSQGSKGDIETSS
jgi:hypothetical protein